jgi:beta-glucanase (GH16 family)
VRALAAVAVGIAGSLALPAAVTHAAPKPDEAAAEPAQAVPVHEPVGWRPLFATDFSGTDLPVECESYEGPQGGAAASYYRPDEVAVSDGLLHLTMRRRDAGGRAFTAGGIGCRAVAQTFGRYEFRARVPAGAGIDSFVTLWPTESGHDKDATLVEILARPGAEKAYLTNQYGSGSSQVTAPGRYSDDFHTYTIEWSPSFFRVLIDGTTRMTDAHVSAREKWIGFAMSSGDPLTGRPDAATPLPAEFQVDWLRVYAYDPQGSPIGDGAPGAQPGTAEAPPGSAGSAGRILTMTFVACALAAGLVLLVFWYARLRDRRRLRPAHRA